VFTDKAYTKGGPGSSAGFRSEYPLGNGRISRRSGLRKLNQEEQPRKAALERKEGTSSRKKRNKAIGDLGEEQGRFSDLKQIGMGKGAQDSSGVNELMISKFQHKEEEEKWKPREVEVIL
jgi:hypothetical protein